MSIQINPYISALQEVQKTPALQTQKKSGTDSFGALLEEKQKQLDTTCGKQVIGKKYQSFGRTAEASERRHG